MAISLSRLLVIDLQAGKLRTIPAMKYRPAVRHHVSRLTNKYVTKSKIYVPKSTANCRIWNLIPAKGIRIPAQICKLDTDSP